ncbi:MAG: hypothetical protein RR294_04305 [Bacilli bacterium]
MKKGFTLIELLAIIIIMGTISILSFSSITDTIRKNKEKEIKVFEKNIFTAAELYITANLDSYKNLDEIDNIEKIKVKDLVESGYLNRTINNPTNIQLLDYYVIAKRTLEKGLEYTLSYQGNPSDGNLYYTESILNGAVPELDPGMIPITFVNNKPVKADLYTNWYDYETKKWANVVLVSEASRNNYKNAKAGKEILEADILAYFVWVPRYKFKLFNIEGKTDIEPKDIEIIFENNKTQKSTGTLNGEYLTQPGFTLGNEELNGIWMGKFETSGTLNSPLILPFKSPNDLNRVVSELYLSSEKFKSNVYGLTSYSRMSRNSEWMSAAYLSASKYGKNSEVFLNAIDFNVSAQTGCGANLTTDKSLSTCVDGFGTQEDLNYPQSTTGNITGIYDMSGGAMEYVLATLYDSSTGQIYAGGNKDRGSRFNGILADLTVNTLGVPIPDLKYFDLYLDDSFLKACDNGPCYGHGLIETYYAYNDRCLNATKTSPWYARGGHWNNGKDAGIFSYRNFDGFFFGGGNGRASYRAVTN